MLFAADAFDDRRPPPVDPAVAARLADALASGGDRRIRPGADGRNLYHATVLPTEALAYGSSTISSLSEHGFNALLEHWHDRLGRPMTADAYAEALAMLRRRLTDHFDLADTAIVFAASGTDLEYVGLAAAHDGRSVTAVLLGRDEVGSGCVHSAAGRFFADETAIGASVVAQTPIDPAFATPRLVDVAVRDAAGRPRASAAVAAELALHIERAAAEGRRAVVHVVHGSKSGLTLPAIADVERLAATHGDAALFVVDACQLRMAPGAVRRYLALGCVVLMTGSKFVAGPPFSGIALVPGAVRDRARPLPGGYRRLAARAEWPADWPGAGGLAASGNFGLLLRLQGRDDRDGALRRASRRTGRAGDCRASAIMSCGWSSGSNSPKSPAREQAASRPKRCARSTCRRAGRAATSTRRGPCTGSSHGSRASGWGVRFALASRSGRTRCPTGAPRGRCVSRSRCR